MVRFISYYASYVRQSIFIENCENTFTSKNHYFGQCLSFTCGTVCLFATRHQGVESDRKLVSTFQTKRLLVLLELTCCNWTPLLWWGKQKDFEVLKILLVVKRKSSDCWEGQIRLIKFVQPQNWKLTKYDMRHSPSKISKGYKSSKLCIL